MDQGFHLHHLFSEYQRVQKRKTWEDDDSSGTAVWSSRLSPERMRRERSLGRYWSLSNCSRGHRPLQRQIRHELCLAIGAPQTP